MRVAIVTDSTCDIPPDLAIQNDITVIPNVLVIDGKEYLDGVDISREYFYELIPSLSSPPTTAAPAPGVYEECFRKLIQSGYDQIVSIHPPEQLSGIFNAAWTAAQQFGKKVAVFDSGQLSLGLGFQALQAAESAKDGLDLKAILEILENLKPRAYVVAMLDTLEYVRRSGRVSWARSQIGALLQLKPFIDVHMGQIRRAGNERTRPKGIQRLKEILLSLGPLDRLAVMHSNAEMDARHFLDSLDINLPSPPLLVNVTPIIGTHVGPNALGFAVLTR